MSIHLVRTPRNENRFRVTKDPKNSNQALFSFDFLDYKDGAVIEILHTGSVRMLPKLEGTIKGIPQGIKFIKHFARSKSGDKKNLIKPETQIKIFIWSIFSIGFILTALNIVTYYLSYTYPKQIHQNPLFTWFGLLYMSTSLFLFLITRKRYPKTLYIDEFN